tara:strand:- start:745 stop:984 length:240 start_codon:yes stop_codon:yes gene_type:complete
MMTTIELLTKVAGMSGGYYDYEGALNKRLVLAEISNAATDYWMLYNEENPNTEWLDADGEEGRRDNINADPSTWEDPYY